MLEPLRDALKKYDLFAKKSLGQNFLLDENITDRIAAAVDADAGLVIEIGPGPGGLTRSLLKRKVPHLTLIEKDRRFIELLKETVENFPGTKTEINESDALKTDWKSFGDDITLCANLPYNVATPILLDVLGNIKHFRKMILMFQKEVAQRITAPAGGEHYGRLSIISQLICECEMLFDLPPGAFTPPPQVTSSVVLFRPRPKLLYDVNLDTLQKLTGHLFSQRRKMLRVSLKVITDPEMIAQKTGVDLTLRPENLTIEQFCSIANCI